MQFGTIWKIKNIFQNLFLKQTKKKEKVCTSRLYRSIHKLPLHIFIDCLVAQEYSKLIIEGKASHEEVMSQFEALYSEYVELIGGASTLSKIKDTKYIFNMQTRCTLFDLLVKALNDNPSEELFNLLYTFTKYHPPKKEYSLENVALVVKAMIPHYKSETIDLMNELDAIKLKNPEGEQKQHYTYEYFTSIIAELESAFKLSIGEDISVGKFCIWVVKYKAYVKSINEQKIK